MGLINPIVITRNGVLVAGERRFRAIQELGWTHISSQYIDELDQATLALVELEENIRRKDISWQERTLAIQKYHSLKLESAPDWRQEDTAKAVNVTRQSVQQHLIVAKEIKEPNVNGAATFKAAIEKAQENMRRRDDSLLHTSNPVAHTHILHGDFLEWCQTAQDKYNFIHCDFPYGINYHNSPGQASSNTDRYLDTPETYWTLFNALAGNLDNFCSQDAHIIFWFSPNLYCPTWELLKLLDGFTFEEHPLIWHRPGEGIAPDPYRRPRRVYEMAFYGWRGNAKILHVRDNLFAAPTERENHPHEKSETALNHFFSMFVDEHTRLLDPTCGSGSALRAGLALGARVFGVEKDEAFARSAAANLAAPFGGNG